jgi:DNA polymerase-1
MKKALIVDALQLAHRVFWMFQNPERQNFYTTTQIPSGVQFGSLRILHGLVKQIKPDCIYFAWDKPPKEKHLLDSSYKSNRPPRSPFFVGRLTDLKRFWSAFGVIHVSCEDNEADDVIGCLVKNITSLCDWQCFILSSDDDFLQLVDDGKVVVVKPHQGKQPGRFCDKEWVERKWGVPPTLLPDLRAILGDKSDTLPGVPRFSSKKAISLVRVAGGVRNLYQQFSQYTQDLSEKERQKLKTAEERVLLNLKLMRLKSCGLDLNLEKEEFVLTKIKLVLEELEFRSSLSNLDELIRDFGPKSFIKVGA